MSRTAVAMLLLAGTLLHGGACRGPASRAGGGEEAKPAWAAAAAAVQALDLPEEQRGHPAQDKQKRKIGVFDSCVHPSLAVKETYRLLKGVTYAEPHGEKLNLDLMVPEGKGPFPLVILIHGGGWVSGKREELYHEQLMLVEQGIASATVDYRLANAPETKFPAAVEDIRCAVRYLRAVAGKHRLDPKRVLAMGPSSGGHLAAMAAVAGDDPRFDNDQCKHQEQSAAVAGVVAFYAPLDLRPFMGAGVPVEILTTFLGVNPIDDPKKAALASPITHLDAKDPPFLLVHGADDILVPPGQSRSFKWALDRLGVPSLHVEVPKTGHGFFMFKGSPLFRKATCTTIGFIRSMLDLPPRPPPPKEK